MHRTNAVNTTASTAASTSVFTGDQASPKPVSLEDQLESHDLDEIDDEGVKAFVKKPKIDANDPSAATHIAQWCLDNAEPAVARAALDTGRVTRLRLTSDEAIGCLHRLVGSSHLADVQIEIVLSEDANAGASRMDKLVSANQSDPALRNLRFTASGMLNVNAAADWVQLRRCFDAFEATPHLVLDVSDLRLNLSNGRELLAVLLKNRSLEALTYSCMGAGAEAPSMMGNFIIESTVESVALSRISFGDGVNAFLSSVSKSTSLAHLDIRECSVAESRGICRYIAHDLLPNIRSMALPHLAEEEIGSSREHVHRTRCLANNHTLKILDVSKTGYPIATWASQLKANFTLEEIVLPSFDIATRSFRRTAEDMKRNRGLIRIGFRSDLYGGLQSRILSADERSELCAIGPRNLLLLELNVDRARGAGRGFAQSTKILPEDPGSVIGEFLAQGPYGQRDTARLLQVSKATYIGTASGTGRYILEALRTSRLKELDLLCCDLSLRDLRIAPKEAADVAAHENMPRLLGRAVRFKRFDDLICNLSEIGIELPKLRLALNALNCKYQIVLNALDNSAFNAGRNQSGGLSVATTSSEPPPPAVRLFVEYGVLLPSSSQFGHLEQWCNANGRLDVLVAAVKLADPEKLTIKGSLKRDDHVTVGNLFANSARLRDLGLSVECSASDFRYLMAAIGANEHIESLTVAKPVTMDIDVWCSAIKKALESNRKLQFAIELPAAEQARPVVRELVKAGKGRVTFS
jgi:hypothetical protein